MKQIILFFNVILLLMSSSLYAQKILKVAENKGVAHDPKQIMHEGQLIILKDGAKVVAVAKVLKVIRSKNLVLFQIVKSKGKIHQNLTIAPYHKKGTSLSQKTRASKKQRKKKPSQEYYNMDQDEKQSAKMTLRGAGSSEAPYSKKSTFIEGGLGAPLMPSTRGAIGSNFGANGPWVYGIHYAIVKGIFEDVDLQATSYGALVEYHFNHDLGQSGFLMGAEFGLMSGEMDLIALNPLKTSAIFEFDGSYLSASVAYRLVYDFVYLKLGGFATYLSLTSTAEINATTTIDVPIAGAHFGALATLGIQF